ncbi:MAG: PAS domain-containing protein [Myxococcales bacterium]|jgi:PAS domain-containing protein
MSDSRSPLPDLARACLDALPDLVALCRYDAQAVEARIVEANRAALLATGLSREEILGALPRELMLDSGPFMDREARRAVFEAARRQGVFEVPAGLRLLTRADRPALRVRVVWPDPEQDLLLFIAEVQPAPA